MPRPNRSDVCAPATRTTVLVSSTTAATTKRTFRIVILRESSDARPLRLRRLPSCVHARIPALHACPGSGLVSFGERCVLLGGRTPCWSAGHDGAAGG